MLEAAAAEATDQETTTIITTATTITTMDKFYAITVIHMETTSPAIVTEKTQEIEVEVVPPYGGIAVDAVVVVAGMTVEAKVERVAGVVIAMSDFTMLKRKQRMYKTTTNNNFNP